MVGFVQAAAVCCLQLALRNFSACTFWLALFPVLCCVGVTEMSQPIREEAPG